ncbi:ABC transporter substrate-binding protein [Enterococcus casseliflavus]|uniref:ABC transporter substrate-binding protein n=1 Tax=Enterococcus casseliflavus TaxID=37734 RepID=UPI00115CEAB5|nr:sugar ABC transporter substrate-binding protein [Enterococcus casseliflavus]
MRKRLCLLGVVCFVSILFLSACSNESNHSESGSNEGKVSLTMTAWGNPAEQEVYQRAIDAYMKQNENVSIELIPAPGDTYAQQLLTQLQGSQAPDLFYVGEVQMAQLIATGRLIELTDFLESEDSYVKVDDFASGIWGPARRGEQIYGVSVDSNPMLLYYNKKVLEEAGLDPNEPQKLYESGNWTWDNFQKINETVTANGKYGHVLENGAHHYFSWLWSNGGEMYGDDGSFILPENERGIETFAYLTKNVVEGNFTYAGALPEGQGGDAMFMSNQTAFVSAGRWFTPMFSENEALEFDYIPYPTNTGEQIEPSFIATAYLAVGDHSKNKEEALRFLSYYTSEQGQRDRLEDEGNAVPSVTAADDIIENATIPEHANYLIDARDIGKVEDKQALVPGLSDQLESILDLLFLGQLELDEAVVRLEKTANELIEANQP